MLRVKSFPFTVLLGTGILILGAQHASASARGQFERTLNVSGTVNLQVGRGSGSHVPKTGNAGEVGVVGKIYVNDCFGGNGEEKVKRIENTPPIQQSGNDIRTGHIDDPELNRNVSISYELVVPASTEL